MKAHTMTVDVAAMTLDVAGDVDTMDAIPDADYAAALAGTGLELAEPLSATTWRLRPVATTRQAGSPRHRSRDNKVDPELDLGKCEDIKELVIEGIHDGGRCRSK